MKETKVAITKSKSVKPIVDPVREKKPDTLKAVAFTREMDGGYTEPVIKINFGGREWVVLGEPFINVSIVKAKTEELAKVMGLELNWK